MAEVMTVAALLAALCGMMWAFQADCLQLKRRDA